MDTFSSVQDEVRSAMQRTADPRPARTRRAILVALEELFAEGNAAPAVSDIARRAGVSRSSFYTQFKSMEHLGGELFAQAFAEIDDADRELRHAPGMTSAQVTRESVARVVTHVAERREFYRVGLPATMSGHLEAIRMLTGRLKDSLPIAAAGSSAVPVDASALFIAGGVLTILNSWVLGELTASADEVTGYIIALLPDWIADADQYPAIQTSKPQVRGGR